MAEQFARKTSLFGDDGINFNVPVDLCPETQYPYTLNVYSSKRGTVQTRPGLTLLSSVTAARVAAKRVNNSLPGSTYAFQRFSADAAGNMYGGLNGDVLLDSGFSGSPPAFVTAAPAQSPETWLYAADKQRMRKFRCDQATVQNIGIFPPNKEPSAVLGPPQYKQLLFGTPTAGGIAGVPGAIDRIPASTTIRAILYDVGTTGWCCLAYTNASNDYSFIGRGAQATYGGTEASVMEQVFTTLSATTVAGIHYDSGSTGLCTIQMSTPFTDLERNQMLQFPSEYVRVLSVTKGPDGLYSFRCSTVGTISAGNSITSIPATRTYLAATHAAGETVQAVGVSSVFTLAPTTTQGIGYLTVTSPLDLSQINGRPVTIDDYMHISIRVDHPELVLFGRVLLDVDAVTNDFTHNFYYQPFEHNDFTAASQGTSSQTASQQASIGLQQTRAYDLATFYEQGGLGDFADAQKIAAQQANPYADYPISTSMQAVTGSSVWTEFLFKISELQRVGSDETRNLANVKAFRLELTVSGTVTVSETAWWVGGTFGPDVLDSTYGIQGFPILARYRYRNSQTGAISVQSPALRAGVVPRRQNVWLTGTPSPDPQVDYIDWEVFGGAQEGWHYAGTGTNTTDPYIFDLTTTAVLANDPLSSVAFPPVPASDSPKHAIVSVVGTAVTWVSGDPFNPKWAAGGTMHIGTKAYTLYAPPASATFLTTVENVGTLVNANFVFAEPTLLGQSVPLLWGPDQQGRYFYAGDPYNPGNVYPSNADADGGADGVSDQTVVVVSSPSDPVMNGAVIEDVSVVLTSNTLQRLQPTPAADTLSYTPIVLETGKGLYARWGMVVSGTALYYVGNQGIYRWTQSTGSVSITEERLAPLFPHASIPGRTLTLGGASSGVILHPPDYSQPDLMRLGAANGYILFDYVDTVGTPMTLAYREANGSWWPWQYIQPPPTTGFVNDAMLTFVYQFTTPQTTDAFPHAAAWGCHEFLSNPGVFNAADTNSTVGIVTGSESLFHYSTNYTDYGIPSTPANDALWANRNDLASAISLFAQTTFYFFISSECTPTNAPLSPEADLDVYACYIDLSLASGATVRMWASTSSVNANGAGPSDGSVVNTANATDQSLTTAARVSRFTYNQRPGNLQDKLGYQLMVTAFSGAGAGGGPGGARFHYQEEGPEVNTALVGMLDGSLCLMSSGTGDKGTPISCRIFTKAVDSGDPRSFKIYGDGWIKANTQGISIATSLLLDDYQAQVSVDSFSTVDLEPHFIDLHGNGQLHRNLALLLEWVSTSPDEATQEFYYWELNAWEVHPQTVQNWTSQPTTHGLHGYQHIREVWLPYSSSTPVTFQITADGIVHSYSFASTAGAMVKARIDTDPIKGKLFTYGTASTAPLALFFEDIEVRVKEWGSTGPFQPVTPFSS